MNKLNLFKKELKEDWELMGFNGVPLFLAPSSASGGKNMQKKLGYSYSKFLFKFVGDVGEMNYLNRDFDYIWKQIKLHLAKNPNYLKDLREQYLKHVSGNKYFNLRKEYLSNLSNDELIKMFRMMTDWQTDSIDIAHLLDAVNFRAGDELFRKLVKRIGLKDAEEYITLLTSPTENSFIANEENELLEISKDQLNLTENIEKHRLKYEWLENSYAGNKNLTSSYFIQKIRNGLQAKSSEPIKKKKGEFISKLKLPKSMVDLIDLIDFCAVWQDERKANLLRGVGSLDKVADEVSERTGIPIEYIYYLVPSEIRLIKNLSEIKTKEQDLAQRRKGIYILQTIEGEIFVTGEDFIKLNAMTKTEPLTDEIKGFVANKGYAKGKAQICLGLESIKNFQEGNILVAPMTRPEYAPAMKKAIAIVTDEGGITSHAAIVSRELNIPCVIGTKVATKIIKDGDLVEVDANKGLVRKLK